MCSSNKLYLLWGRRDNLHFVLVHNYHNLQLNMNYMRLESLSGSMDKSNDYRMMAVQNY